jgi:hypothetical protein
VQIRNVSPYGDLDVPLLQATVPAGEAVEVAPLHAQILLAQADNWAPADDEAQAVADDVLAAVELAASDGVPPVSAKKSVWVAYAQQRGDEDAESKTKEQLIAEHGADSEAAQ